MQGATMCTSGRQTWCIWAKAFTDAGGHDGGAIGVSISLLGASLRGTMLLSCEILG
jgi:hypothetical protein